ncbi:MAG: hypothetical protein HQL66_07215 [Magnetococcales bacterium]|nr:hypothetical protein [Magnetococcales bacterium]
MGERGYYFSCLGLDNEERLLCRSGVEAEEYFGCEANMDLRVVRESFERAGVTLGQVKMDPNPIKQAGHRAFWVRKLKPFTVNWDSIKDRQTAVSPLFFNEYVSVMYGFQLLHLSGYKFHVNLDLVHDLITGLRYDAFSPASITAVYQSMLAGYPANYMKPGDGSGVLPAGDRSGPLTP